MCSSVIRPIAAVDACFSFPYEALSLLRNQRLTRQARESILRISYRGYDASAGWMGYDDLKMRKLKLNAIDHGFRAFELKAGSDDEDRDVRATIRSTGEDR